jgi:hypothetical protein
MPKTSFRLQARPEPQDKFRTAALSDFACKIRIDLKMAHVLSSVMIRNEI